MKCEFWIQVFFPFTYRRMLLLYRGDKNKVSFLLFVHTAVTHSPHCRRVHLNIWFQEYHRVHVKATFILSQATKRARNFASWKYRPEILLHRGTLIHSVRCAIYVALSLIHSSITFTQTLLSLSSTYSLLFPLSLFLCKLCQRRLFLFNKIRGLHETLPKLT